MSRGRRVLAIVTASVAVLALGFVVSVASASLPGSGVEEPILDLDFRADLDLSSVFSWILLALAVVGAVLFAMGLKQSPARQEGKRRGILGAVIGLILFVLIARYLRPVAESLFGQGADAAESASEVLGDEGTAGSASGWIFSILLAAILAAALTRIGLSVRAVPSGLHLDSAPRGGSVVPPEAPPSPVPVALGGDPRSRVISAYASLEIGLEQAGQPRRRSETTASHAVRAAEALGLEGAPVREVVGQHSRARYGIDPVSDDDAGVVESIVAGLQEQLRE